MDMRGEKVPIKVGTTHSKTPPLPPSALKLKLDLSQIASHPLVQNRSPETSSKSLDQSVLRSRTNSQVGAQVKKLADKVVDANNNSTSNGAFKIRRSTSMSYTSTLRKRKLLSPGDGSGSGDVNVEFPSPKPNVQLPNFSISPYSSRTPSSRRLSLKEQN